MTKTTYETLVHKANLPLATNESLNQFTSQLSTALRAHATKKLGGANKSLYPYLVETYSDSCVCDVYTPSDSLSGGGGGYKYYATPYTRDADGTFNFGKMVEVLPVKTFQPVGGLPIVSNTTGVSAADASTVEATKSADVPAELGGLVLRPNWAAVEKNLWNAVL